MKKFIALLLSVLLCFSLCACGGKSEDTQTTEPSTEATTEETTEDINTLNEAELFSAKFCMVYMKHLKNPYSFTVRSIWCYKQGEDIRPHYQAIQHNREYARPRLRHQTRTELLRYRQPHPHRKR